MGVGSALSLGEMANELALEGTDLWVLYGLVPEREGTVSRFYCLGNGLQEQQRVGDNQTFEGCGI